MPKKGRTDPIRTHNSHAGFEKKTQNHLAKMFCLLRFCGCAA